MASRSLHRLDPAALGRWRLLTRLGTGTDTVVYRAADGRGRVVALKAPAPGIDVDRVGARLRHEGAVLDGLRLPGSARLVEDGSRSSLPYLALEAVDGPTLRSLVSREGRLRGAPGVALLTLLADALARLHGAGVCHGDVKPANIVCASTGPVLVDFDAASRPGVVAQLLDAPTMELVVRASPGWLSPEQALGESVGPSTDVFAWSAVAAFALTGRPPFGTGHPAALLYRVVHEPADLAGLPPGLRSVLVAGLAKDPLRRPTAEEVRDQLRTRLQPGRLSSAA